MAKQKSEETMDATSVAKMPHIGVAILNIIREMSVSGISKDRTNTGQGGFKFRGIDDVLNALAPLFAHERILVLPSYANRQAVDYETSKTDDRGNTKKSRLTNVTIEGTYKLVSLVDGSELVAGPFVGEGMDSGDKATNKAMSIAYKYFAIQTFAIPVVGSEDPDYESHEPEPKARRQTEPARTPDPSPKNETVEQAIKRLASTEANRKKLKKLICDAYNVTILDQLPEEKIAEAIGRLEKYAAKAKK